MKQLFAALFLMCFTGNHLFAQEDKTFLADEEISKESPLMKMVSATDFSQAIGISDTVKNAKLYNTIKGWLYTKYRYGGKSDHGIDCSGFTKALYNEAFGIQLTGGGAASIYQQDVTPIDKEEIKEGDLVFFIIRKKRISHVGVYLGSNKFVHASRHAGVIISNLNDSYYKKRFYKAGRHKSLTYEGHTQDSRIE